MAILGQIRKRSFFLIVVIGMALFAFVISGVFVGSGITQGQEVGEINGEEIDYESFNLMVQQVQDAYGLNYSSAVDYAWEMGLQDMVLVQELEKLGINVWEVIDAASTKPFGYMKFSPGPGLGGHCIPIDPHYLSWKLKTLDYDARFIQLAGEINTNMPNHILKLISINLNKFHKSLNGSKILILGVAYKKNINDQLLIVKL